MKQVKQILSANKYVKHFIWFALFLIIWFFMTIWTLEYNIVSNWWHFNLFKYFSLDFIFPWWLNNIYEWIVILIAIIIWYAIFLGIKNNKKIII